MATREVIRFGPFKDLIANGVKVGNAIYLSGQVSVDAEGAVVGAGDLPTQIRQAYANVAETLAAFGAGMDDIVDEMWLVTDIADAMSNLEQVFTTRAEAFGKNPDITQTMVEVAGLVFPELLIEIKVVAYV